MVDVCNYILISYIPVLRGRVGRRAPKLQGSVARCLQVHNLKQSSSSTALTLKLKQSPPLIIGPRYVYFVSITATFLLYPPRLLKLTIRIIFIQQISTHHHLHTELHSIWQTKIQILLRFASPPSCSLPLLSFVLSHNRRPHYRHYLHLPLFPSHT